MRRVNSFFLICIIILTMLTGCYDAREVNDFSYVAMLGIDKGKSDIWRITLLIPFMGEGGSESKDTSLGIKSEGNKRYTTFTIEAPSFFEGVDLANTNLPRKINFMHTNIIVFSEELAKSGMAGEFIAPLIRQREVRRTEYVVVSMDSAEDFVKAAGSSAESSITKEFDDLIKESDETGYYPKTTLNDMYNAIKSTYRQPIAIYGAINNGDKLKEDSIKTAKEKNVVRDYYAGDVPRSGKNKIEFLGCAVANGDVMVGKLTGWETRMVLIARGDFKRGVFTIQDPKMPDLEVPIDIRMADKPKIKVSFKNGNPIINVKLELEGDILAIKSRIDYENPKLSPVLEKAVEQHIKDALDKTIEKCKALRSDIFNFGYFGVTKFKRVQEWESYNWNKKFEKATVNTAIKFRIRRNGTMLSNSPIISTEGEE